MTGRHQSADAGKQSSTPQPSGADGSWVTVGQIVGVFGVRGELRVVPFTDVPDRFSQLAKLFAGDARIPYEIVNARPHKGQVVLRLRDVDTVEQAERLRGQDLFIPEAEIAVLPDNQYYLHDLIGLRVEDVQGVHLGEIADVQTGAGNDLFVVRTPRGGEVLLPAVKAFVKSVDLAARVVHVDPIPGLFDADVEEAR